MKKKKKKWNWKKKKEWKNGGRWEGIEIEDNIEKNVKKINEIIEMRNRIKYRVKSGIK